MKTIVMGGGVVGVAAAYYLAREGHEVTLVERRPAAGRETSFANAGLIAPGHATAWASPRAPMILLKSLVREDSALKLRFNADPRFWIWGLHFLRNCTSERQRANTLPKLRLCLYSQQATKALLDETGIDCDMAGKGILYLYRHAEHLESGVRDMALLKEYGHAQEVIDAERCVRIEPALAPVKERIAGAIFGPRDESGDCHKFTHNLASYCEHRYGVTMLYDTTITGLEAGAGRVEGVITNKGVLRGENYVMSLGVWAPQIARTVGVSLPIYPVKGYSLSFAVDGRAGAPTVGGVDEENLVAWARLGECLRVTGTAEFSGYDTGHGPSDFAALLRVVRDLFPDGADYDRPSYRACLRPMTPDGPPILGRGRLDNLYFNAGQGHMGWTMACGSGRIVADLVSGRRPEIELKGMTADRR